MKVVRAHGVDENLKVNFVLFAKQARKQGLTPADCHFILSVLGQWDEFVEWGKQVVAEGGAPP